MIVLDTHVWIWLINGSPEIKPKDRTWLSHKASSGSILIPAISLWEISMLASQGKILTTKPILEWTNEALTAPSISLAPLTPEIAIESCYLPGTFHGDPADRLIVATARIEKSILVTRDQQILNYGLAGNVNIHAV